MTARSLSASGIVQQSFPSSSGNLALDEAELDALGMVDAFSDLSAKEFAVLESVLRKLIVSLDKSPRALRAAA